MSTMSTISRIKNWGNAHYDYSTNTVRPRQRSHLSWAIVDEWEPVPIPKFGWEVVVTKNNTIEVRRDADGKKPLAVFKEGEVPQWLEERLAVLMMINRGYAVEGVGKRIWDNVYWVEGVDV